MTYKTTDFVFTKLLSNSRRMMIGYFELSNRKVYSFAYGFPNGNDDYFVYCQITKQEYDELNLLNCKTYSMKEYESFYDRYVKNSLVLCNEFEMNPDTYKASFEEYEPFYDNKYSATPNS